MGKIVVRMYKEGGLGYDGYLTSMGDEDLEMQGKSGRKSESSEGTYGAASSPVSHEGDWADQLGEQQPQMKHTRRKSNARAIRSRQCKRSPPPSQVDNHSPDQNQDQGIGLPELGPSALHQQTTNRDAAAGTRSRPNSGEKNLWTEAGCLTNPLELARAKSETFA